MPTQRHGYIRRELDAGRASVVRRTPFTVKLDRSGEAITSPLILGIDPGHTLGIAVIQQDGTPVFLAEVETRSHDIPDLMKERAAARRQRRQYRRNKRQRRARANGTAFGASREEKREFRLAGTNADGDPYNPLRCHTIKPKLARIHNRKNKEACYRLTDDTLLTLALNGVPEDVLEKLRPMFGQKFHRQNEWLAAIREHIGTDAKTYKQAFIQATYSDWIPPTVEHLFMTHQHVIEFVCGLLPISQIVIEYASFDIHKMQNPDVNGIGYQHGPLFGWGYENVKQYVIERDGHLCQLCRKKSQRKLHVHHVIWRRQGGADTQSNLVTLCTDCHDVIHHTPSENRKLVEKCKGLKRKYQKTTIFNIIMPRVYAWLKTQEIPVKRTFGYLTKWQRKQAKLEKSHAIDAYIIALQGTTHRKPVQDVEQTKVFRAIQERRHNRQLITRVEDRKYFVVNDEGKKDVVAKNRGQGRTGQTDKPGLDVLRAERGEAFISQLHVEKAKKPLKTKGQTIQRGDTVLYHGKPRVVRGFGSYGSVIYLHAHDLPKGKETVKARECRVLKKNSGLIWN